MGNMVTINGFQMNPSGETMTLNVSFPQIGLSGTVSISQSDFVSAMQKGGFDGVKKVVVDRIIQQLQIIQQGQA